MRTPKNWSKTKPNANLMLATFGNRWPMDLLNWFDHWKDSPMYRAEMMVELAAELDKAIAAHDGTWFKQLADLIENHDKDREDQKHRTWLIAMQRTGRAEKMTVEQIVDAAAVIDWYPDAAQILRWCKEMGITTRKGKRGRKKNSD